MLKPQKTPAKRRERAALKAWKKAIVRQVLFNSKEASL